MEVLDQEVFDLLKFVQLPKEWQVEIRRLLQDMDIVRQVEIRKHEIDDELRRVARAYADGGYSEASYERRRSRLISEKNLLVIPEDMETLDLDVSLEKLGDYLEEANDDEKKQILHLLFESIYFDFDRQCVSGFKPQTEFVDVFHSAAPFSGWVETGGIFTVQVE